MGYSDSTLKSSKNSTASNGFYIDGNGININNEKIVNMADPTSSKDAVTLGYATTNYLSKQGDTMGGNLNMNSNKITNLADAIDDTDAVSNQYLSAAIASSLSFINVNEIIKNSTCTYKIDKASIDEVSYNEQRKVSYAYSYSVVGKSAFQTAESKRPSLCDKANKINDRYYLTFDGSNCLDSTVTLSVNCNVFVVYKLTGYKNHNGYHNTLYSFSHYMYFVCGTGDVILRYASSTTTFGTVQVDTTKSTYGNYESIGSYQTKASADELNKWICLSIHYYKKNKADSSFVYCNGKLIGTFKNTADISGSLKIGAINDHTSLLEGNISFFIILNQKMTERSIKLIHHVLSTDYSVDHDSIVV